MPLDDAFPLLTGGAAADITLAGAPEGQDARTLADLAAALDGVPLLHIAADDARAARLTDLIGFFAPDVAVLSLPAWDCLPYDRVSPNAEIVSRRIHTLSRLTAVADGRFGSPTIVITTVGAASQRFLPPEAIADARFAAKTGDRLDLEALRSFLARNGYSKTETVREPGEFAVRGGIFDLFPPGRDEPIRIDLFDDEIEGLRRFDPSTQRTLGPLDAFVLAPMSEFFLDPPSIDRFRHGYRSQFGTVVADDPLYEAISAGRRYGGAEHWLPLFHERMATVFDYLTGSPVSLDPQFAESLEARAQQVADFHEARQVALDAARKAGQAPYRPIAPETLYLPAEEMAGLLAARPVARLSPFGAAPGASDQADCGGRQGRDFADVRAQPDANLYDALAGHIGALRAEGGRRILVTAGTEGSRDRLAKLMADHGVLQTAAVADWPSAQTLDPRQVGTAVLDLDHGFKAGDLAVITEQDILGDRLARPARRRRKSDQFIAEVSALAEGDLVVHVDHGIGRYDGLETVTAAGAAHDCLRLIYAGDDKLFLPVENIELLSRFGSPDAPANLDRLGGAGWQARKARVAKRLKDMAGELIRLAAERATRHPGALEPPEGPYQEFCARFPYSETEDQQRAIDDVIGDFAAGKSMDRLVCGDVGFGKTEVALRAAYVAAMNGSQVAVVVPTTLLARQHYLNFTQRFAGTPLRVGHLSRFVSPADAKRVREGLASGDINIVVGTHALLSDQIKFSDLALLIIDEEQHFGVRQKEKLKALKAEVHVLTLSATPIPRTLQMSLSGVRDLSLIATPPVDRLAVRTFVLPFDGVIIREAIMREHFRGGQTYYVCPRIADLDAVRERLEALVPEVRIGVAHGRLASRDMEDVMTAFYEGRFDVLLSTSIVESGLDVPTANTLVVHRADMFGLAQLYQLRGRIGRAKLRAYAYLTTEEGKKLNAQAKKRLQVIERLDSLGAGFSLASYDMDIRGAGNLLGEEQSGHIREVGVELYQHMLEEAVQEARAAGAGTAAPARESWTPQINIGTSVLIPEEYVADLPVRLELYRRAGALVEAEEVEAFAAELIDRFGPLPAPVENLLEVIALKQLCRAAGIERLDAGPKGAIVAFRNNRFAQPDKLIALISGQQTAVRVRPDHKVVFIRDWASEKERVKGARSIASQLAKLAA